VASPALSLTSVQVFDTYFAKDVIERDFGVIKGLVELRPVHHRTDAKVRAHVSICVLALLLARLLEQRLKDAGVQQSAERALDTLASCHLNQLTDDAYSLTQPQPEQTRLLATLGLSSLLDDATVEARLTPR
jgi:hypothetical protein